MRRTAVNRQRQESIIGQFNFISRVDICLNNRVLDETTIHRPPSATLNASINIDEISVRVSEIDKQCRLRRYKSEVHARPAVSLFLSIFLTIRSEDRAYTIQECRQRNASAGSRDIDRDDACASWSIKDECLTSAIKL